MIKEFQDIARQLESRGAVAEARQLERIADSPKVMIPSRIVEAVRLLGVVQAEASKDPSLMHLAARASLLSHQIQALYSR